MLSNTFYGDRATRKTRESQREASKASEGLERVLELAKRSEPVASEKSVKALDYAIVKLGILKSRIMKHGELKQVEEQLEKVVEEKTQQNSKRVDDLTRQIELVNEQIDQVLAQREMLTAQIVAASAVCKAEEEIPGENTSDSAQRSDSDDRHRKSAVISDYCKGDWDDSVDGDFPDD